MKTFRLRIVSPDQVVYDGDVEFVQFMGMDGSYGILANHAPLMTATRPGPLRVRTADGETTMVVTDGFAEMSGNVLTIAAEAGERADEIDVARARAAEQKARDLLANRASLAAEDALKAEDALRRAMVRQLVGQRTGGSADRG
ncbi:MAG: ATP synthase F1 subunit epsilon [Planctomycetota bacterium]|nr:ATP synthase F1 subunit epsilon [Planctomycetota bacterium]MDA0933830.1 ATP synthase F1 subunit epsilon [Planctomycetota bacterium]MDA1221275.1 ATP synthase F1 subunit epsilon [Planctomycetota bacterium]